MKTAIYARISDDKQGTGAGVERQQQECQALADREGWEVVKVYSDNSISAYNRKKRPGFDEMVEMIRSGHVDAVVTWAADRLTRHPRELEDLVDLLNETGTKVKTVTSGEYDLTNADGRAHARIVGAIARQESEKKSERIKSQKAQAAARGDYSGGRRAFGWTSGRADIIPREIAIVREMADRVLAGEGINTITKDLTAREVRTATGITKWHRRSVRQILRNPATAGLRRQKDGGVIPGNWQGAYDRDTWNQLSAALDDPSRKTTYRIRSYLLIGLVYDHEGRRLTSRHWQRGAGKPGYRLYATPPNSDGGRGVSIRADLVEELATEAVLQVTDDLEIPVPVAHTASDDVASIEAQLEDLAAQYGQGELTAGEWQAAKGPLRIRLADARAAERRSPTVAAMDWGKPGLLRASWEGLTIQQKRQALEMFIERIDIGPGKIGQNGPDPDRISIVWKA